LESVFAPYVGICGDLWNMISVRWGIMLCSLLRGITPQKVTIIMLTAVRISNFMIVVL